MANKTLYTGSGEDAHAWDELARYLRFYEGRSLSSFLAEKVKEELARLKAKEAEERSAYEALKRKFEK